MIHHLSLDKPQTDQGETEPQPQIESGWVMKIPPMNGDAECAQDNTQCDEINQRPDDGWPILERMSEGEHKQPKCKANFRCRWGVGTFWKSSVGLSWVVQNIAQSEVAGWDLSSGRSRRHILGMAACRIKNAWTVFRHFQSSMKLIMLHECSRLVCL